MSSLYEQFLERHRAALLLAMRDTVVQYTPNIAPTDVTGYTERLVQLYLSFCLGKPPADFAEIQEESIRYGVTPTLARPKSAAFINFLHTFCEADKNLTVSQRSHINRMLDASFRYMQTMVVVLKPEINVGR